MTAFAQLLAPIDETILDRRQPGYVPEQLLRAALRRIDDLEQEIQGLRRELADHRTAVEFTLLGHVALTGTERRVLEKLLVGRPVDATEAGFDSRGSSKILAVYIHQIRKKLGLGRGGPIANVWGGEYIANRAQLIAVLRERGYGV